MEDNTGGVVTGDLRCYMGDPHSADRRCRRQVATLFDLLCPTCKAAHRALVDDTENR